MVYGIGLLALIIAMSISLSYDFAKTNKVLEEQLIQVKQLSDLTIEQERKAKEKEIEKRLLEADNERKTKELEEAKKLQLSLLPKSLPRIENLDIQVFMQTATEVGGDYYDFYLDNDDNSLTVLIGDATGHGARAGVMVAATKSLFSLLSLETKPLSMIKKFSSAIKSMNFHNLFMALTVVKIESNRFVLSNAGMPPALLYSFKEKSIKEIVQKSMPLGSFNDFPYYREEYLMNKGDCLLLMSDGFIELFNDKKEIFGILRAKEAFSKCARLTSSEIIESLKSDMMKWSNGKPLEDDVTFVVIKFI